MVDRLWTGKPPWRGARHPSLLSLSLPSVAGWNEYTGESWESKQAPRDTPVRIRGLAVFADAWLVDG